MVNLYESDVDPIAIYHVNSNENYYIFNIILGVEHKEFGPKSHGTQTQWLRS